MEDTEIQKLLRLKRYEQPPADYFENFLREFHRRQRAEIIRRPLWRIALDRFDTLWLDAEVPRFAYAAGAVAVVVLVTAVSALKSPTGSHPALAQVSPVSGPAISLSSPGVPANVSLGVAFPADNSAPTASHQAASRPRYILDSQPVSYDLPASF